jgi:DNA repair exonuclease SbcCD ATPase subunit
MELENARWKQDREQKEEIIKSDMSKLFAFMKHSRPWSDEIRIEYQNLQARVMHLQSECNALEETIKLHVPVQLTDLSSYETEADKCDAELESVQLKQKQLLDEQKRIHIQTRTAKAQCTEQDVRIRDYELSMDQVRSQIGEYESKLQQLQLDRDFLAGVERRGSRLLQSLNSSGCGCVVCGYELIVHPTPTNTSTSIKLCGACTDYYCRVRCKPHPLPILGPWDTHVIESLGLRFDKNYTENNTGQER